MRGQAGYRLTHRDSLPEFPLDAGVFPNVNAIQQATLGGAGMPNRARLIYECLKFLTFLAVLIALAWSVWRLLS